MTDTIFALASAPGRAGVAVLRVSGPASWQSLQQLTPGRPLPEPRKAVLRSLKNMMTNESIDEALVLGFRAPQSFTGEDVVEYHLHGGHAVVAEMLQILVQQKNHRLAEPGEFTRRAFESGRMDLTAAEAVADLINAETQLQKAQALRQMDGALKRLYDGWAERLKKALAYIEAELEFPDEDLPPDEFLKILPTLKALKDEMAVHLNDGRRGERLRGGLQVAVIGAPNAGKSSLVNALTQRDIAIVSPVPGTTRDVLEAHLDIKGYPVTLIDTAGLRPEQLGAGAQDQIEAEGIRRAVARAQQADIVALVFDGTQTALDQNTLALLDERCIVVLNKADQTIANNLPGAVHVSALTGQGLESLINAISERAAGIFGSGENVSLTRQRHRSALEECMAALTRAEVAALPELLADDVRLAVRALGRITGRVDVEDLLDSIFRDFCIGK